MKFIYYKKHNRGYDSSNPKHREIWDKVIEFSMRNFSDWSTSLCLGMTEHADEVYHVITHSDKKQEDVSFKVDGVNYLFIKQVDFVNEWTENCDVFFQRGLPNEIRPPSRPTTMFYSACAAVKPKHKWDFVLSGEKRSGTRLFVKGMSERFWNPTNSNKKYDFVILGRKGKDMKVVREMLKRYPDRKFVLAGWSHQKEFDRDNVVQLGRLYPFEVRGVMNQAKWGIITCMPKAGEGWPMQTQLEYSMMGLKYARPSMVKPSLYVSDATSTVDLDYFRTADYREDSKKSRQYAVDNFSAEVSAESVMEILHNV